jgi:DNA adenine methylase
VPYFGGKSRLAGWIVGLMPEHRVYVEPFAGSAAVLLAKPPSRHEILNDVDGNIVTFFRVLRDRPEDLERACRLTPYARDEFAAADLADPSLDDLERARRWWIRASQSFAKTGTTATGWATSILRNSNQARTAANRIDRFAGVAERLSGVTIEHRDALDVIREYSAPDGLIYADPPYVVDTRSALKKRPAGDYSHEFATVEQHQALAAARSSSPSTVLLSGYLSPLYEDLYAGWTCVTRTVSRHTGNSRSAVQKHTTEALWCNRAIDKQLVFESGVA